MATSSEQPPAPDAFELATLSDLGGNRSNNEDSCGHFIETPHSAIFAIADGIGGYEGGEVASKMAIDITLQTYRESPPEWGAAKRLNRAVQRANIEVHNTALTVPELRRMGTTLTAVAIENGALAAAHVGDCRLYLLRGGRIVQLTKDHTMVGERVRMGMMSEANARIHPERSMLLRSVGRELIVSVDRISMALRQGDEVILCTDGLYGVLQDAELMKLTRGLLAEQACRLLVDTANERGTADNLTVAFFRQLAQTRTPAPERDGSGGSGASSRAVADIAARRPA